LVNVTSGPWWALNYYHNADDFRKQNVLYLSIPDRKPEWAASESTENQFDRQILHKNEYSKIFKDSLKEPGMSMPTLLRGA